MSHNIRKRTFRHVRPVKIQISPHTHAVRSESSLNAFWIGKDVTFLRANNETDQIARMRRLIFVGHACQKVHFLTLRLACYFSGSCNSC